MLTAQRCIYDNMLLSTLLYTTESRVILLPSIIHQLSHLFFTQDDMANQILGDILLQLHKEERVSSQ